MGFGPMTGRGAGYCAGFGVPGYANSPGGGRGRGVGGGGRGGRGWRHRYYATGLPGWSRAGWAAGVWPPYAAAPGLVPPPVAEPSRETTTKMLREQAEYLEEALADVKKRLEDLESPASE